MKKTALISLDALSDTEFERLKNLKNFNRFFREGVYSKSSLSVYPTQTYTVHTSVITGNFPDKHGVYNNQYFQPFKPGKSKKWFWYRNQIKSDTLYDAVRRQKGKVSSVLWHVTGKAKIKNNVPEILAVDNENQAVKVLKNSSFFFALRSEIKYGSIRRGISQPALDNFAVACAIDSIRRHSPDLLMLHLVSIDAAKHNYGVESPKIDEALVELDKIIGRVIEACGDEYTIIMFSDHGQFTVEKEVYLNVFMEKNGLLNFRKKEYKAYIESMGGSAVVRAKSDEIMEKALALLNENKDMLGIEDIYSGDMLQNLHVDKNLKYIIEAKAGYHFKEENSSVVIRNLADENIVHATHGYSPYKQNYKCVFFAMGDGIKAGHEIKHMSVTDIAPSAARILGLDEFSCDGKVLDEIFE
ncbi:MAG: alkaline phosphatase family protein [Clostridia bacterium]|nr:alkaline phosphatase family protein [Clostridia bacterium]